MWEQERRKKMGKMGAKYMVYLNEMSKNPAGFIITIC